MNKYIFKRFNFSNKYKKELIEFLKNISNAEIGGNRLYDGSGNHYMQNAKEIAELVFYLKKHQLKKKIKFSNFLEIGYAAGINNSILNKFFTFKKIVSVDIIDPSGTNTNTFFANLRFKNLTLVFGDSTDQKNIETVKKLGFYDLIFIDGGHDYETAKKDFQNYSKFLSRNGLIILHDIKSNLVKGVPKLWNEIKSKEKKNWLFKEIFDSGQMMECGLGILSKKNDS